jgi:hypothetical protein
MVSMEVSMQAKNIENTGNNAMSETMEKMLFI